MNSDNYNQYKIINVEMYPTTDGFRLDWLSRDMGFGIILFKRDKEGKYSMDTEMMSKEFCQAVLQKFLDKAYTK